MSFRSGKQKLSDSSACVKLKFIDENQSAGNPVVCSGAAVKAFGLFLPRLLPVSLFDGNLVAATCCHTEPFRRVIRRECV